MNFVVEGIMVPCITGKHKNIKVIKIYFKF